MTVSREHLPEAFQKKYWMSVKPVGGGIYAQHLGGRHYGLFDSEAEKVGDVEYNFYGPGRTVITWEDPERGAETVQTEHAHARITEAIGDGSDPTPVLDKFINPTGGGLKPASIPKSIRREPRSGHEILPSPAKIIEMKLQKMDKPLSDGSILDDAKADKPSRDDIKVDRVAKRIQAAYPGADITAEANLSGHFLNVGFPEHSMSQEEMDEVEDNINDMVDTAFPMTNRDSYSPGVSVYAGSASIEGGGDYDKKEWRPGEMVTALSRAKSKMPAQVARVQSSSQWAADAGSYRSPITKNPSQPTRRVRGGPRL